MTGEQGASQQSEENRDLLKESQLPPVPKESAILRRAHYGFCALSFVVLVATTLFVFIFNLGESSISLASDEVIYVRITQGMVQSGELFPLRHGAAASFEKPPLKFWLSAILPTLFGESNWTYRLFDGALGTLAIALAATMTFELSRSFPAALVVGLLLLGAPEWVIAQHGFRRAVLDGLLTTLTLLSAIYSWRWCASAPTRGRLFAIAIFCALGVLTKSVAGFIPLLCALVTLVLCGERRPTGREILGMTLVPSLAFAAYIACVWIVGGWRGLNSFLGVEILTRALSGFEGHNSDRPLFYLWYLIVRAAVAPQSLLIAGLLGVTLTLRRDRAARFLMIWVALPVAAYSCSTSKAPWYLNPFMPFVCMTAVLGATALVRTVQATPVSRIGAFPVAILLAITAGTSYSRSVTRSLSEVTTDTTRIPLDPLSERLRSEYEGIALENGAISGRTSPLRGRFNLEGIYRGMMKPKLTVIETAAAAPQVSTTATIVKDSSINALPEGWIEIGRVPPFGARTWGLLAVTYPKREL